MDGTRANEIYHRKTTKKSLSFSIFHLYFIIHTIAAGLHNEYHKNSFNYAQLPAFAQRVYYYIHVYEFTAIFMRSLESPVIVDVSILLLLFITTIVRQAPPINIFRGKLNKQNKFKVKSKG